MGSTTAEISGNAQKYAHLREVSAVQIFPNDATSVATLAAAATAAAQALSAVALAAEELQSSAKPPLPAEEPPGFTEHSSLPSSILDASSLLAPTKLGASGEC